MSSRKPKKASTHPATPSPSGDEHNSTSEAQRDSAALAAALDPIITIDARGIIQSASDSVLRVFGWKPAELVGCNVNVLMPEPHHTAHDGYLRNYHRTGQTNILNRPRRFNAVRRDGTLFPIELCVSRADIADGSALFVGMIRDMSAYVAAERSHDEERVRSQQLLAEQTSALQKAHLSLRMADRMASIGTLAAGLGHDMNNVLLPVRARLNALRAAVEAGTIPASERPHIEAIRKSVAYLQQLADGLHFLALDPETDESARGGGASTDLHQWWAQTGALLSKAVPKHVRVLVSLPKDIPIVGIAAHSLTQAVLNLVVNAGEAIPGPTARKRRQGYVRITAAAIEGGSRVRLSVSDNGMGMSDDVRRRAFEMFYTTKPRGLGTGLGLSLVRRVVDRCGGEVSIESEPGKGTTVALTFTTTRGASGAAERPRARVSICDGRVASLVEHVLQRSGMQITRSDDPKIPDVWVTDWFGIDPSDAVQWHNLKPKGRLILVGQPKNGADWAALGPFIIDQPDDFEAIRGVIGRALNEHID